LAAEAPGRKTQQAEEISKPLGCARVRPGLGLTGLDLKVPIRESVGAEFQRHL